MICSYCKTENDNIKECEFCGADFTAARPKLNENLLIFDEAELPQPVLATFHTYDLLVLLRYLRDERSNTYNLMRITRKAPEGHEFDSDTLAYTQSEYRRYTARARVIEGILIDRLGYKPKRIDDKLLNALKQKMEQQGE